MARRATLLCFGLFCLFFVVFGAFLFLFFFGGFKGQMRWPKELPHWALNPPYLFWFVLFYFFFSLFEEKHVSP